MCIRDSLYRVLIDFQFESIVSLLVPGIATFIILSAVLLLSHKLIQTAQKNKLWIYLSLLLKLGIYSFAGTCAINCVFDYADPVVYHEKVVSVFSSRGSRYAKVSDWKNNNETTRVNLTREQYIQTREGDNIQIVVKPGLFGMSWYYME